MLKHLLKNQLGITGHDTPTTHYTLPIRSGSPTPTLAQTNENLSSPTLTLSSIYQPSGDGSRRSIFLSSSPPTSTIELNASVHRLPSNHWINPECRHCLQHPGHNS